MNFLSYMIAGQDNNFGMDEQNNLRRVTKEIMNDTPKDFAHHETPLNLPYNRSEPEFVSDAIAELLGQMNFDYVFLLPGASYRGLHDSLVNHNRNINPEIILATSGCPQPMAHGYAKAADKPSLCILHDLVGLMNGSMGLYNAYCDRTPILFLGGAGPLDPDQRRFTNGTIPRVPKQISSRIG